MEEYGRPERKSGMSEQAPAANRRRLPIGLTFFGLLAIAGLIAMPILAGKPSDKEMPDIVRFIGQFHPVLLHLPIGVFMLILFQELGAIFGRRQQEVRPVSLFPIFFGAASAIVAVIAGFLLYQGGGAEYSGNALVERHLWGGLVFAIVAVLTFVVKAWTLATAANPAWYRLLLFSCIGIMSFASHDGGSITHGPDFLTKFAPAPIRQFLGLSTAKPAAVTKKSDDPIVYAEVIAPILERRCVSCHKEGKSKGNLRMDQYELLVKGGKEGPGIEPGNVAKSNIISRIELPVDDEDHMPPEGKPQAEQAEIAVIKWWIGAGADAHKKLSEIQTTPEIKEAIAKLATAPVATGAAAAGHPAAAGHSAEATSTAPDKALQTTVENLAKQFPGAITFESQESPLVSFTAVSLRGKLDDEAFGKLAPVLPHLTSADLSATKITDKSIATLVAAKNLRLVRLAETGVTDAAVDTLLKIPTLESINFYGTKVTDAGVLKLTAMPNLKHLYLWQTAVTPDAIKSIKEKLPKCEVITGT